MTEDNVVPFEQLTNQLFLSLSNLIPSLPVRTDQGRHITSNVQYSNLLAFHSLKNTTQLPQDNLIKWSFMALEAKCFLATKPR